MNTAQLCLYYRRALKILNLSNRELASMLTMVRTDGQKTSEATVSRWLTGASAMDAGVLLYLQHRLQQLARNTVQKPISGQVIAVGGGKGGSGASALAVGITLAARSMGYKVLHLTTHPTQCNNSYYVRQLEQYSDCRQVDFQNLHAHLPQLRCEFDFIVADLYRDVWSDHPPAENNIYKDIDLYLTPIDINSQLDLFPAQRFYEELDQVECLNRILVYFARILFVDRHTEFLKHMGPWKHMLYDIILPMHQDSSYFDLPGGYFTLGGMPHNGFKSEDQYSRHIDLFMRVLEQLGIDPEFSKSTKDMNFFELIDLLAPVVNVDMNTLTAESNEL